VWRYGRIDEFDLDDFAPAAPPDATRDGGPPEGLASLVERQAATVVIDNGRVVDLQVRDDLVAKGLRVARAAEGDDGLVGAIVERQGADVDEPLDPFVTLNQAFVGEPVVIDVPAGVIVDGPIVVAHWTRGDGAAAFPRLVVRAGDDSDVTVIEVQASSHHRSLVVPVTEIAAGQAARVGHVTLQQLGLATWQLGLQVSSVEEAGTLHSTSVGFGGDYARLRTDCRLVGRGATGNLDAIYFGEGEQTLDFRTFQDHIAPDCMSNLLFKGAVGGRSQSVYTGLIRVGDAARGTNAFQTNRNIKLSDHAWAWSVPNLVIGNNDVRCSHASAVGPVDEEQRFYLESRGVPTDVAERLIVTGFFGEVLQALPVPALIPALQPTISAKFERREA
jgi:Fe-S cluster assembly protein SufD